MNRWRIGLGVALGAAALLASGALAAPAPDGPRLAITRSFGYPKNWSDLSTVGPDGGAAIRLAGGPRHSVGVFGQQSWSPDGRLLAFTGSDHRGGPKVFVVGADGSGLHPLPGTFVLTDEEPIFMPDGHEVAFVKLRVRGQLERPTSSREAVVRTSIWAADVENGSVRALTPWRLYPGLIPMSFSPDGKTLAVVSYRVLPHREERPDLLAVHLDGGGTTLLARDATDAVYSPDGKSIAFVRPEQRRVIVGGLRRRERTGDVYVVRANGSGETRLTHDGRSLPSSLGWSPSGDSIALVRSRERPVIMRGRRRVEHAADLYVARADGSGETRLTHDPDLLESSPSWDPSGQRLAFTRSSVGGIRPAIYIPRAKSTLTEINADGSCETTVLSAPNESIGKPVWQPGPGREASPISC